MCLHLGNGPGTGFLEKMYANALAHEIRKTVYKVDQQSGINVIYDGVVAGEYIADLLVENVALLELKAVKALHDVHKAQCLNYLKATGLRVCLLINFGGTRVDVKRIAQGI